MKRSEMLEKMVFSMELHAGNDPAWLDQMPSVKAGAYDYADKILRDLEEIYEAETKELNKEINLLNLKLTVATTALECIEDPRKLNHLERDDYTQKACLMNVAHVALKVMRGEYVEV
jgi:hypothetical protein